MSNVNELVSRFLGGRGIQEELSKYAQDSYGLLGRGVVRLKVPAAPIEPGTVLAVTEMVYQTPDVLRPLFAEMPDAGGEDAAILLRMIDTYDPATQAVLVLSFVGTGQHVSLKMRLNPPFVTDESKGGA
jgi:hypothetical protein